MQKKKIRKIEDKTHHKYAIDIGARERRCWPTQVSVGIARLVLKSMCYINTKHTNNMAALSLPTSSHQAITITLHFQISSKDTLLPVSLSCHLASIHQRTLILLIQTLALYKSFTYLLSS